MKKIICFNANEERIPFIKEWAKNHEVTVDYVEESLTLENIDSVEEYDGITVAVAGKFDSRLYPELKKRGINQVAQRTAGYENFDLTEATKNDIIVTNVPTYSPESIAEFALLLALQLVRKSHSLDKRVEERNFTWTPDIRSRLVKDMTVAIIGVGNIGVLTAKLFKGFGATVVGYDPFPKDDVSDILTYRDSVEDAIKDADIVSLHMPAFKDNYHLFDSDMFDQMKTDSYLINCARGTLIDTEDLLKALDENKLAGAALDVYENEAAYVPGNFAGKDIEDGLFLRILNHSKIIYYNHLAYYTDVSVKNMTQFALDATLDVINIGDTDYRIN